VVSRREAGSEHRSVWVVDELGGGGAQRSALITASAWSAQIGPAEMVAARSGSYASNLDRPIPMTFIAEDWPRLPAVLLFGWRLRRMLSGHPADVFLNGFGVSRVALALAAVSRVTGRVFVVEQNTLSVVLRTRFRSRTVRWLVRWGTGLLYRRADAIVGVSEGVSRDLEATLRLPPGSVHTIYNPVDVERIARSIDDDHTVPAELQTAFDGLARPRIITVGRLAPQKAHADLLEAFALLPESQRGSLTILGEGPLRDDLRMQATRLGITDQVWMPGFADNPWWFTARADLFCLSSHHEGHPLALLEALACGVPVVSTDCPHGPREILQDVAAARLTPLADPPALAHAITDLLARPHTQPPDLTPYHPTTIARHYARTATRSTTRQRGAEIT